MYWIYNNMYFLFTLFLIKKKVINWEREREVSDYKSSILMVKIVVRGAASYEEFIIF